MLRDADLVRATIDTQGRKFAWVAERLGISYSYMTRLLSGGRRWTPALRARVAEVLRVPEEVLFCASDCRLTDEKNR
jgi:transcriptional regulator with XRE-family HTH domain